MHRLFGNQRLIIQQRHNNGQAWNGEACKNGRCRAKKLCDIVRRSIRFEKLNGTNGQTKESWARLELEAKSNVHLSAKGGREADAKKRKTESQL